MPHYKFALLVSIILSGFFSIVPSADAATLKLSPDTGVYTVGNTFTANVVVQTGGKSVNAADGKLSFNPRELSVVSVTRASSIFGLWTEEPSFSNSAGTINFGGGSPSGYTGATGVILSITFKSLAPGSPKVSFTSGSILAADGFGTNILTSMGGGSYSVTAKSETPVAEYVAPPNTPKAPSVTSTTHPDETKWYSADSVTLAWSVPKDIVAIRVLLDTEATTIPTNVYEEIFSERTLDDLPQGESFFHIQFKNSDGWGRVTHFRIGVDGEVPSRFEIKEENSDSANPTRILTFDIEDVSPIAEYRIHIDGRSPVIFVDEKNEKRYALPVLPPGSHSILVEAFDSAGNTRAASYTFDIESFEAPQLLDVPDRIGTTVIPALRGETRPNAKVYVVVNSSGEEVTYTIESNDAGLFTFIPDSPFARGVVDVSVYAEDAYGAQSLRSESVRIIIEEAGFVRIGTLMLSVLSVLVPLIGVIVLLLFGTWFLWHRLSIWRRKVMKETLEAEQKLRLEFDFLITDLHEKVATLRVAKKGKLTKSEDELVTSIETDLRSAQAKIQKELSDIEHIIR